MSKSPIAVVASLFASQSPVPKIFQSHPNLVGTQVRQFFVLLLGLLSVSERESASLPQAVQ